MPPPSPSVNNQAKNGAHQQGKDGQGDGNGQNASPRNAGNPHGQPGPQGQQPPPPGMGPPGPNPPAPGPMPTGANTAPPTPGGGPGPSSNSMPNMPPPGSQGPSSAPPQMQQSQQQQQPQDLFGSGDLMGGFGAFDDINTNIFQNDAMAGLGGEGMPFSGMDFGDWFTPDGMLPGDLK